MTTFTVRHATDADLDALVGLRRYAEQWLHAEGIDQWTDHARGARTIQTGIATGTSLVVQTAAGGVIASFSLAGPDLDFWTPGDDLDAALYLYKFMIGPQGRGTGLGDALLDWACSRATEHGKRWLRLDCWRTNTRLQAYYARRGFTLVRTVTVPGRDSGALLQRPATMRMSGSSITLLADLPDDARTGRLGPGNDLAIDSGLRGSRLVDASPRQDVRDQL
ncbi:MAG: hypothetical protein QG671_1306 [Actinomycetota bacterium]|nr:hypothetical protein [Actinomycetota bacterium]